MKNQTRRTTQIPAGNYPSVIDLNQARAEFADQLAAFEQKHPGQSKEKMGDLDPFYLSAKGYFELRNVMAGKASLGPTIRALNTIRGLATPLADPLAEKRLARQGLVKVVSTMEVIGCMHYPEPTNTATIIGSGIIVAIIAIVASLWWEDYKRGTFNHRRR